MEAVKRYAAMKDSGVEWIGEIPKHWLQTSGKRFATPFSGQAVVSEVNEDDDNAVPVYGSGGVFKFTNAFQHDGQAVLFGRKGTIGKPFFVDGKFWAVDTVYFSLCNHNYMIEKYLFYFLIIFNWDLFTTQTAIPSIVANEIFVDKFISPPIIEQQAIASYLDDKCSTIDDLIASAHASIDDYKQLKASTIYEAVTKGLNPDVEMKDSGVEWIGEIPKHVKLSRLGLHYNIILGKMLCPNQPSTEYVLQPYYRAANVHFSGISTETGLKEMWFSPKELSLYTVRNNDLLIVEGGAGAGGAAIVEDHNKKIPVQNSIMIIRSEKNNTRFARYLIEALVSRSYIDFACNKATIPHFTKEKVGETPYPVFPPHEQQAIASFLDTRCAEIDSLIAEKEALIADLEAYKKSLIYECVTGKRRVAQDLLE